MNMKSDDAGKLVLRLLVGGLLILHGFHKILTGPDAVAGMIASLHLPHFFAWGVYLGEVVAPALVILGVYTRIAGWVILANMVVAVLATRGIHIFYLNAYGGLGLELEFFYGLGGLAIALMGAGRFSAGGAGGKWN